MLARTLPGAEVLGADYDSRAVAHARAHHAAGNLGYEIGNIVTWEAGSTGRPLGQVDLIVSFDTIEHLLYREIALLRLAENLAEDGTLVLSTPCAHAVSQLNPAWEHHKIEYAHTDLLALLRRFFRQVLVPQDAGFPDRGFWERLNAGSELYPNLANPLVCRGPFRV